jgi:hypothetical protein
MRLWELIMHEVLVTETLLTKGIKYSLIQYEESELQHFIVHAEAKEGRKHIAEPVSYFSSFSKPFASIFYLRMLAN